MFPLIFSKDPKIIEMVVQSINALYLKSSSIADEEDDDKYLVTMKKKVSIVEQSDNQRAWNLLRLMKASSFVEITCLEEYLKRAREDKDLRLPQLY